MTGKSLFEALARAIGLVMVAQAILAFAATIIERGDFVSGAFWLRAGVGLILGLLLLLKGDALANRVYGSSEGDEQ